MATSTDELERASIRVVGVGGGGCNAVNRMIEAGVQGVDFIAMNTDAVALQLSRAPCRVQLGGHLTRGLGTGGDPERGRRAAEESKQEIARLLDGADMIFITAGMGGGTGTGGAAVIAGIAQELDASSRRHPPSAQKVHQRPGGRGGPRPLAGGWTPDHHRTTAWRDRRAPAAARGPSGWPTTSSARACRASLTLSTFPGVERGLCRHAVDVQQAGTA